MIELVLLHTQFRRKRLFRFLLGLLSVSLRTTGILGPSVRPLPGCRNLVFVANMVGLAWSTPPALGGPGIQSQAFILTHQHRNGVPFLFSGFFEWRQTCSCLLQSCFSFLLIRPTLSVVRRRLRKECSCCPFNVVIVFCSISNHSIHSGLLLHRFDFGPAQTTVHLFQSPRTEDQGSGRPRPLYPIPSSDQVSSAVSGNSTGLTYALA